MIDVKVGQSVWTRNGKEFIEYKISKIGNKYFYVGRDKYNLSDGKNADIRWGKELIFDLEKFEIYQKRRSLYAKISVSFSFSCPDNISLIDLEKVAELLKIKIGE